MQNEGHLSSDFWTLYVCGSVRYRETWSALAVLKSVPVGVTSYSPSSCVGGGRKAPSFRLQEESLSSEHDGAAGLKTLKMCIGTCIQV